MKRDNFEKEPKEGIVWYNLKGMDDKEEGLLVKYRSCVIHPKNNTKECMSDNKRPESENKGHGGG